MDLYIQKIAHHEKIKKLMKASSLVLVRFVHCKTKVLSTSHCAKIGIK